ncbi:uncharacterized protein LOC100905902 [Galendromus occidentalis]|uniref:Uncharacterized protein LOC100905902 n=1 Tax=Galendromus occidentalis TaxID=34638 RepID=A0AAJ6QPX9_9ACAR|nr:uncharacterized protein LOC100905902 [Galendromus occidentalis]
MYVALFVCTATRGVHFEVVQSMSTIQTHLALRRFLSLYPACSKFISDNAKSFIKAATEIKAVFNSCRDERVRSLLAERRIDWDFICPRAPWRGGMYERLVGTFKRALVKTLGSSYISFEEFRTIVAELGSVINDRPITHASTDVDAPTALTPGHLLRGGPPTATLASVEPLNRLGPNGRVDGKELRDAQKMKTSYFRSLSVRWYREYILMLRSANLTSGHEAEPIQINDVCLLKDDNLPRVRWVLVRVLDAHPGRDGLVRTYTVRFENGTTSRRPAQLLIPLEETLEERRSVPLQSAENSENVN